MSSVDHGLRFGDTILLFDRNCYGYIAGDSLLNRLTCDALHLQSPSGKERRSSSTGSGTWEGGEELPMPPNLRLCRFKVIPRYQGATKGLESVQAGVGDDDANAVAPEEAAGVWSEASLNTRLEGKQVHMGMTVMLQHIESGRFLTMNRSRADLDPTAMRLVLGGDPTTEASIFRIQSGYKSKKAGERVSFMDSILLFSEQQSIHVSTFKHDGPLHAYVTGSFEVNVVSGMSTRLQIIPSSRSLKLNPQLALKLCAGSAFTLLHRDFGAHLEFSESLSLADPSNHTDDHEAKPRFVVQKLMSSNCVWKMESLCTMWEGGLASMDQLFRIKHLASQRYLIIDEHPLTGELHLYMTRAYLSPSATFQLEPFDASLAERVSGPDKTISFDELLFVKNHRVDKYLSLDTMLARIPMEGPPASAAAAPTSAAATSKWKKAALTLFVLSHKKNTASNAVLKEARTAIGRRDPKDAFDMEPVDPIFVSMITDVRSGLMALLRLKAVFTGQPPLFPQAEHRSEAEIDAIFGKHVDLVQDVIAKSTILVGIMEDLVCTCSISDVDDPLVREGVPVLSTQMIICEQGVMAAILEIHHSVFQIHQIPPWCIEHGRFGTAFFRVIQLTYRLLKQAVKDNPENKAFLAPHAKAIQNSLGSSFKAIHALRELFHDNTHLLKTAVDIDLITMIISLAENGRKPRFLEFLSAVCFAENEPLAENQFLICNVLLEHEAALIDVEFEVLSSTEVRLVMTRPSVGEMADVSSLKCYSEEFVSTANHLRSVDPASLDASACEFLYVLSAWQLFVSMSQGRNRRVIDKLLCNSARFGLLYPMLLAAMNAPKKIPATMRGYIVDLIVTFFVDREPLQMVPPVHETRVWPKAAAGVQKLQRMHLEDPWLSFPLLRPPEGFSGLKDIVITQMKLMTQPARRRARLSSSGTSQNEAIGAPQHKDSAGFAYTARPDISAQARRRMRHAMRKIDVMSSMAESEHDFAVVLEQMQPMDVNENEIIISQGDIGDRFYFLDKGTCEAYIQKAGAAVDSAMKYASGDCFGELALLYNRPRAATVIATTDCRMYALSGIHFREVVLAAHMANKRQVGDLLLTRGVLNMTKKLLQFGFYHNQRAFFAEADFSQVSTVAAAIVEALNEDIDTTEKYETTRLDYENRCIMLSILELCFDARLDRRITLMAQKYDAQFASQFPVSSNYIEQVGRGSASVPTSATSPSAFSSRNNKVVPTDDSLDEELTLIDSLVEDGLNRVNFSYGKAAAERDLFGEPIIHSSVAATETISATKIQKIVPVLMKLISYSDDTLSCKAFRLLHRHMTQRNTLAQNVTSVQMLAFPEMISAYQTCFSCVSELRRQIKWLRSDGDNQVAAMKDTTQLLATLTTLLSSCKPRSRCKLQTLLRNMRADRHVMSVLQIAISYRNNDSAVASNPHYLSLATNTLNFICQYTVQSILNSSRIFVLSKSLSDFMQLMGIEGLNAAQTIGTVLQGNPELLKTAIDHSFVSLVLKMLHEHGPQARWIDLLSSIIHDSDGKPIVRNQDMISLAFSQAPKTLLESVCKSIKSHNSRSELLNLHTIAASEFPEKLPESVLYGIQLVRLLAQTCQGGNVGSQVRARLLLPLDAAVRNVLELEFTVDETTQHCTPIKFKLNQAVHDRISGAYLQFLQHAFFECESEFLRQSVLQPDSRVWTQDRKTHPDWRMMFGTRTLIPHLSSVMLDTCFGHGLAKEEDEGQECEVVDVEEDPLVDRENEFASLGSVLEGRIRRTPPLSRLHIRERYRPTQQAVLNMRTERIAYTQVCAITCSAYLTFISDGLEERNDQVTNELDLMSKSVRDQCDEESLVRAMFRLQRALKVDKANSIRPAVGVFVNENALNNSANDMGVDEQLHAPICQMYLDGWNIFCSETAIELGVQDLERGLGFGFQLLTQLLLQPEPYVEGMANSEVLRRLCELIVKSKLRSSDVSDEMFEMSPHVIRLLSCCIHLDGVPPGPLTDDAFYRFVANERPVQPLDQLRQIQNSFDKLGATAAALTCFSASDDALLQLASVRLLLNLLHESNTAVQASVHRVLTSRSYMHGDERFAQSVVDAIQEAALLLKKADTKMVAVESQVEEEDIQFQLQSGRRSSNAGRRRTNPTVADLKRQQSLKLNFSVGDGGEPGLILQPAKDQGTILFSNSICHETIELLIAMTKGSHRDNQHFLLSQNNKVSFNVIRELASALEIFGSTEDLSRHAWMSDAVTLIIKALMQACQGPCRAVQNELASSNFPLILDGILADTLLSEPPVTAILSDIGRRSWLDDQIMLGRTDRRNDLRLKMSHSCVQMLNALLESVNSSFIPSRMLESVSSDVLKCALGQCWVLRMQLRGDQTDLSLSELTEKALLLESIADKPRLEKLLYDTYFLLRTLQLYEQEAPGGPSNAGVTGVMATVQADVKLAATLQSTIQTVEVIHDGNIVRIDFETPAGFQQLLEFNTFRAEQFAYLLSNVSLSNPLDKSSDFLRNLRHSTATVKYLSGWVQGSVSSRLFASQSLIRKCCFRLALLCTFVEVVTFDSPGTVADTPWTTAFRKAAPSLSITHMIFSVIQFVQYFIFVAPLPALTFDALTSPFEMRAFWKTSYSIFRNDAMPWFNLALFTLSILACARTLNKGGFQAAIWDELDSAGNSLGKSNIFYPLILADYMRTKAGTIVVSSIRTGGGDIMGVVMIGVLVMMLIALLSFEYFREDLDGDVCHTLFNCVGRVMTVGFTFGLEKALGDGSLNIFAALDESLAGTYLSRAFFIVAFYLTWNVFLQNIIIGQIVDSFTEIRDVKKNHDADLKLHCFVCSVARSKFLAFSGGFEYHVNAHHRPMAYLGYSIYLDLKPAADHNGVEKHVAECIREQNVSFLPIGRSLLLQFAEKEKAQQGNSQVAAAQIPDTGAILAMLERMQGHMNSLEDRLQSHMASQAGSQRVSPTLGRLSPQPVQMAE